jgi:two-component system phosphate regulon response regulator OmpR
MNKNPQKYLENQPHVLVVDDDERLRALLSQFLSEQDFLVTTAADAKTAREILACFSYDLIVCDVMMPGEDGMALTRGLRQSGLKTPILLLTALGEVTSRISGLEAGADDYLPKPFEPKELLLRIHAILRRVAALPENNNDQILLGKWTLDMDRGELQDGGERIALTAVEHTLIRALVSRRGEVVSREDLAELCQMNANERTIDVQVTRLRKKVEEDPKMPKYIQTVRGKGYILWPD